MALITAPTQLIPDLQHEYHTVTIDTIGQTASNAFTCHLQNPLKNVVQAKLLAANINTTVATKHCYVPITPASPAKNNFLVIRFVCRKPNL